MKITIRQLKQLIKEQVDAHFNKPSITDEDIAAEADTINKNGALARHCNVADIESNIKYGVTDDNGYPGWTKEDFQKLLAMIK